jgi:serine/threonine-protein kinase
MVEANMNTQFKQTPLQFLDCETVDQMPGSVVNRAVGCPARGQTIAAGAASQLHSCIVAGVISVIASAAVSLRSIVAKSLALIASAAAAVFPGRRFPTPRPNDSSNKAVGQYRLLSLLGTGGMGEVYLAEHRRLKRRCAIKLIRPELAGDAQILARFEREVRATAQLTHWNTVAIFDHGRTDDGTVYYAMEYLPGLSLDDMLQSHGPQPAERVVHMLRQACRSLSEAHALGLVHRDIKPANLFAARCGGMYDVVKVLDFGLVKTVAEIPSARLTQQGALSGTPLFMSPEQARGSDDVDGRSDIYSLGAVAYTLLVGRPIFERETPMEVLIAQARDEVTPPSELCDDVPADLEQVVLRCLAKKPEDRYQDMDELERALARCLAADAWTQADAARWWEENAARSAVLSQVSVAA